MMDLRGVRFLRIIPRDYYQPKELLVMAEAPTHMEAWKKALATVRERYPDFDVDHYRTDYRQVTELDPDFVDGHIRVIRGR